jgi:mxaA protein
MNTSIRFLNISVLSLILLFSARAVIANDEPSPEIPEGVVKLYKVDPTRNVGYLMGDILHRTITLEVKKPFKLIETTLPIVGYEHRYQGQVSGIELRKINHTKKESNTSTSHVFQLAYQVFATSPTVKPALLPAEIIKFQGPATQDAKDGIVQFRIPEFYFRISPMAVFGAVKIEDDMSPLRPPILLQPYLEKQKLVACLVVLGFSLLGLLYIIGSRAWLPLMGKPFAKASRQLRKLSPNKSQDLKFAISEIHKALNETAKYSVFSGNVVKFINLNQSFKIIETEIGQFFILSHQVFFDTQDPIGSESSSLLWLRKFCKQCRDCERGLKPAKLKKA